MNISTGSNQVLFTHERAPWVLLMISILSLVACADLASEVDENAQSLGTAKTNRSSIDGASDYLDTSFALSTPLGEEILEVSKRWEQEQLSMASEYAQPRMCAHNVSYVLERSGLQAYSDYLVPHMLDAVKVRGGLVRQLDNRDKQGFIDSLNRIFNGRLPLGTLVNGCLYRDCSGEGGDGHIAILGETDEDGVVYLYHNNWYRPDNEGGVRKPYMVSEEYYEEHGLRRQWMKTPWIRVYRDRESDLIVDVEGLLPAIDDLDPYTGFFITVSIIPELLAELDQLPSDDLFCPEGMNADPILGACVDSIGEEVNVYGRFPQAMIEECDRRGYGQACRSIHTIRGDGYEVEVQRWSKRVYQSIRGDRACPRGLELDRDLGYCVQRAQEGQQAKDEAFGPFSKELVRRCFRWGGGNACASGRWSLDLLKGLLR